MFNYINDVSLGNYSEELVDILLELYNKIKEKFKCINNNTEILTIDNSLDNAELMLDSLNKLTDMLEMNPLFKKEFLLSLAIINDVEYIVLDNKHLLNDNIPYIGTIIINFCKLILDKQDMLLSNKILDYEKEYNEFKKFYNSQKEVFYLNLPKIDEDYNDAIVRVTNSLW